MIHSLEELVLQGKEMGQFVSDFTWYLRNLMLVKSSSDSDEMLDMSGENIQLLKEEAQMIETGNTGSDISVSCQNFQVRYATLRRKSTR